MKSYKILIFGCGNIGSRHLQGVLKDKNVKKIIVVEKENRNIEIAKQRVKKIKKNFQEIQYYNNLNFKDKTFDLVILSTNSSKRLQNLKLLIKCKKFKNLILEKVVFQKISYFKIAIKLLKLHKIKAWVNCTRRSLKIYKNLKKELKDSKLSVCVKGRNWNMGSNIIHFLDLFNYLSQNENDKSYFEYSANKGNKLLESKRKGFFEIEGSFLLKNTKKNEIYFEDNKNLKNELIIQVQNNQNKFIVNETKLTAKFKNKNFKFKIPFQSEISKEYIKQIKNKNIDLATVEESFKSHKMLFELLDQQAKYTKKITNKNVYNIS